MKTPHKHAELIKAWADGAEIECRNKNGQDTWEPMTSSCWDLKFLEFRIKPEPKPDVVIERMICVTVVDDDTYITLAISNYSNCRFVFDGETKKLKSAEVLK